MFLLISLTRLPRLLMSIINTHFIPMFSLFFFFSVFMLNKFTNALIFHLYDQVNNLVELCENERKMKENQQITLAAAATMF